MSKRFSSQSLTKITTGTSSEQLPLAKFHILPAIAFIYQEYFAKEVHTKYFFKQKCLHTSMIRGQTDSGLQHYTHVLFFFSTVQITWRLHFLAAVHIFSNTACVDTDKRTAKTDIAWLRERSVNYLRRVYRTKLQSPVSGQLIITQILHSHKHALIIPHGGWYSSFFVHFKIDGRLMVGFEFKAGREPGENAETCGIDLWWIKASNFLKQYSWSWSTKQSVPHKRNGNYEEVKKSSDAYFPIN